MRSFVISTIVFLPASFFLHRYLEDWGLDKGRTRTLLVMLLASIAAYGVAFLVDLIFT
ncbi:MAG: hypothetical protein H6506_03925 [Calditrichaeota bacterium]|nr:hypothetical protein [Calditrichota bacterium]MCB9391782.1 hypothetical protein [Calditrichota bacterium]